MDAILNTGVMPGLPRWQTLDLKSTDQDEHFKIARVKLRLNMETSLLRRSNLLCILELNVVKQVDPMSRRRFNWGGGPCIVYGGSGLIPMVSAHLWKIYALPRVLYGLEVQTYLQSDIQIMEQLQRSNVKKNTVLPE